MTELKTNFAKIKDSNLVVLVEKQKDLELLENLKLEKNILEKIKSELKEKKEEKKKILSKKKETKKQNNNSLLQFFLWTSKFENLYILVYKNKKQDIEYFLWEKVKSLPEKLTLVAQDDRIIDLLNTSILARYKFQKYKTEKKEDEIFVLVNKNTKNKVSDRLETLENIVLARNLWTMPANYLTPEEFAKIVKKTKFKNTKVKILDYKKIVKLGMWLIEAVWKGSANKPRIVILERIVSKKYPTIWLVGKWVTFDTGWIQVKPGDIMYEMKWDMCWAANVFAIMKELDKKDLKVNIVACLTLAENHISWESYKPSDIIKSYSGKTVDVIHTDAEGRLVLADGISYISKNYKLDKMITMATLTWACMVALGFRYAWIMWTDEKLINKFLEYSKNNFEKYNKLPFDDYFVEKTKSEIADLQNLDRWVQAGATIWAAFLSNFLLNNEDFTHIDIAWTALNSYEAFGLANKGMTGFGVDSVSSILKELE